MSIVIKSDRHPDAASKPVGIGKQRAFFATVCVASALMLGGCFEIPGTSDADASAEPSSPEDYEYKGRVDPLTATSGADRAGALQERFMQVQGRE